MEKVDVTLVVDVELNLVKELLLTKLGLLNNELGKLNRDVRSVEWFQKENKNKIKNIYANLNTETEVLTHKARLHKVFQIHSMRKGIAGLQGNLSVNKKKLTALYKRKYELKQQIAKYNALADLYHIRLYRD